MTLEELINSHKEVIKYSEKMKSLAVNTDDINRLIKQHTQELEYLEELKTLRVELEKNSKELEVYKKALGLACKHWSDLEEAVEESGIEIKYHIYSPLPRDRKVEVYLCKARKQNDD